MFINYVVVIYKIMVEFVLFILGRYVFFYVFKVKVEIFFMKKIIIFERFIILLIVYYFNLKFIII